MRLGQEAYRAEDLDNGIFLLEEAQFHARRVRAQPLCEVIAATLGLIRSKVFSEEEDQEELFQQSWRTLVRLKVDLGCSEILSLWACHREDRGDVNSAEKLRRAAERHLKRWSDKISIPHQEEHLASFLGLQTRPKAAYAG